MTYRIIGDSCLNLTENMKEDPRFQIIPLALQVGSTQVVGDGAFGQKRLIEMVKTCPECPKTVRPSPETFKTTFVEADAGAVPVTTPPSHLSGSYNSVAVTKKLREEEMAEKGMAEQAKKTVVIDSFSASSGELNITLFIQSLCGSELEFDEMAEKTLAYRDGVNTYFVLKSLGMLRKNGRLSGLQVFFTIALNIKPVMGVDAGTIVKLDQARGMNKVLHRICDIAVEEVMDMTGKIAVVCHVNNPEWAGHVKNELAERVGFKKIAVINAADVVIAYANNGGVVLAV